MPDTQMQTKLNSRINDALQEFATDWNVNIETVLAALDDAKSDAPTILKWAGNEK